MVIHEWREATNEDLTDSGSTAVGIHCECRPPKLSIIDMRIHMNEIGMQHPEQSWRQSFYSENVG